MAARDRVTGPAQVFRQVLLHLGGGLKRHRVEVLPYGRLAATLPLAITRSALCGVLILLLSTNLNRIGLRLRL